MQPRDPSCPAPPPFFVRALIPIWKAIVRAYGKVSLGEVRAKHETHGLSALMKPCFAIFFYGPRDHLGECSSSTCSKTQPRDPNMQRRQVETFQERNLVFQRWILPQYL